MDKEILEKIKKELLERKKQIENDLKSITQKTGGDQASAKFPNIGNEVDDNVLEIEEYSTNLATEKVLESALRDINNALDRIEKGTYGICKYCGQEINEKRLMARPVASACVECKSKLQQQT